MARRNTAQIQFDALSLEGAILPPDWLARVAALEAPAQSAADYGIPKGLQLRDEIGRYWRVAQAIWADFVAARGGSDSDGAARRLTRELLTQVFGFTDLAAARERTSGGRVFPLAFEALEGRVPVIVGPPTETLDQNTSRHGDGHRRRSAWGALQEYLNAFEGALWGLAANGLALRIGRDNASLTRPAWLEADLERIFAEERFADFSVLWLLLHASRFGRAGQPVQEMPLERWREAGREEGSRARDALRLGVEEALRALGQGFVAHPANAELRAALATGTLAPADYFNELLRLVYRMIFLLTVEERGILHASDADPGAVALYAGGYGMRRLRERALRHAAHDRHGDLWMSLRPVFAALGRAEGEPALGLPGLGGLFAPDQCPHLDEAALENRALLTAVFRLAWLREGDALARVNWKDMGVEELGSVYEGLLELIPWVGRAGYHFELAASDAQGSDRKNSGSYYTPDALVQQLLDTALEPVVAQRLAENPDLEDAERALLSLTVVDPACGSGHFLLAAARRLAGHLARLRAGGTPGAVEYRHALRDVVTHCIHGVDRNPMALELARMALWLEAYTPDRALGFLDHHLVCGDALLGLLDLGAVKDGIPDEAFKALTGDDKDVAKLLTKLNRAGRKALDERRKRQDFGLALGTRSLGEAWAALDALSDDGLAGVEAKRAAYVRLRAEAETDARALAADLFVGAFLMPKRLADGEWALTEVAARSRFPSTSALVSVLDGTMGAEHTVVQAARYACVAASVLHWPLAFPQVFARGGFDVVLANPPWLSFTGRQRAEIDEHHLQVLLCHFDCISRWPAAHPAFLVRSTHMLRTGGRMGLVLPLQVADLPAYGAARAVATSRVELAAEVLDVGEGAFPGVTQRVGLFSLRVSEVSGAASPAAWVSPQLGVQSGISASAGSGKSRAAVQCVLGALAESPRFPPKVFSDPGVHTGNVSKKIIRDRVYEDGCTYAAVREGRDIVAYGCGQPRKWLWLEPTLEAGDYCRVRPLDKYAAVPIVIRQTADRPIAARHVAPTYFRNTLLACAGLPDVPDTVLLAFLNSATYALRHRALVQDANQKAFPQVKVSHLHALPAIPKGAMRRHLEDGVTLCDAIEELVLGAEAEASGGRPVSVDTLISIERLVLHAFDLPMDFANILLEEVT
jgi:hypothetical protein